MLQPIIKLIKFKPIPHWYLLEKLLANAHVHNSGPGQNAMAKDFTFPKRTHPITGVIISSSSTPPAVAAALPIRTTPNLLHARLAHHLPTTARVTGTRL